VQFDVLGQHAFRDPDVPTQFHEEWRVSVFTINEAMDLLAAEGLVVSKARAARTVNAPGQVVE
jgi:DNA-binding GntR family transcriptional regulator